MTSNELITIENLLHEHEAIRAHMQLAANLITDRKSTGTATPNEPDTANELAQAQISLRERLHYLDEGLKQHNRHEEEFMPALIGNLLMEPLLIEHREMAKELTDINYLLADINPECLIIRKSYIKIIIDSFNNWVIDHSAREDVIFNMLIREFSQIASSIKNSTSMALSYR